MSPCVAHANRRSSSTVTANLILAVTTETSNANCPMEDTTRPVKSVYTFYTYMSTVDRRSS
jgi:hypothetical protein